MLNASNHSDKLKRTGLINQLIGSVVAIEANVEILFLVPSRSKAKKKFGAYFEKVKVVEFSDLPTKLIEPSSQEERENYSELIEILKLTQ